MVIDLDVVRKIGTNLEEEMLSSYKTPTPREATVILFRQGIMNGPEGSGDCEDSGFSNSSIYYLSPSHVPGSFLSLPYQGPDSI